jgi:hypothetical protein
LLEGIDSDPARQYLRWVYYLDEPKKTQLLKGPGRQTLPSHRVLAEHLERMPTDMG